MSQLFIIRYEPLHSVLLQLASSFSCPFSPVAKLALDNSILVLVSISCSPCEVLFNYSHGVTVALLPPNLVRTNSPLIWPDLVYTEILEVSGQESLKLIWLHQATNRSVEFTLVHCECEVGKPAQ